VADHVRWVCARAFVTTHYTVSMVEPDQAGLSQRNQGPIVAGVLLLVVLVGVFVWVRSLPGDEGKSDRKSPLDALRTDKTWRDSYREMTPIEATAFAASFADLADPKLHPRMGHGVVVRGHAHSLDMSSPDDPVLVLVADPNMVRCRFAARQSERLADLASGQEVVIGGALTDVVKGTPILMACHFEDEWTRR